MRVDEFDYHLPPELIARRPTSQRDASRLLVLHRGLGSVEHRAFPDLLEYLQPNDLLVLNETKVFPARLWGVKEGGGARIELLLLTRRGEGCYEALANRARRLSPGTRVRIADDLTAVVRERLDGGLFLLQFEADGDPEAALVRHGEVPLPPYLDRPPEDEDRERYQTVYARHVGSAAAPTAGLHFTQALLDRIEAKGIGRVGVTLHIGLDTFQPITVDEVEAHTMHREWYSASQEAVDAIRATRESGGRVVAVGTTAARVLESISDEAGACQAGSGETALFIYPGYRFRQVDLLLTNFHLPRSTLLLMVSALAGTELLRGAYREAVDNRYRFYSYGDAMLIAP